MGTIASPEPSWGGAPGGFQHHLQAFCLGKTEVGLTAGRTGNKSGHDSQAARGRRADRRNRGQRETPRSRARSHTPGQLSPGGSSNARAPPRRPMPVLTKGRASGPRPGGAGQTAHLLTRRPRARPSAAWCPRPPRPPLPSPTRPLPRRPPRAHDGLPDVPSGLQPRPKALTVPGGRAQAPPAPRRPRLAPSRGAESS